MNRFSIILLLALSFGIIYSYIIAKFFKYKILLFLPTIFGALWFIYTFTLYIPKEMDGFGDLAIFIVAMMVFALMMGNIVSGLFVIYRRRKK